MAERAVRAPAWALAGALGAAYLLLAPASADLAAQQYRAALGLVIWDGGWYGGHHMPAYSVLFPPLASILGAPLTGALAAVGAAAAFERLATAHFGRRARAGALWFALGTATLLLTGRLTFTLGLALGTVAVLAATRGRTAVAALVAAAAALSSPVAGAFLGLAGGAWWIAQRGWAPVALGAGGVLPALALTVAFPEGGTFPFAASSFWPSLAVLAAAVAALPREERLLRAGGALYAAAMVASFAVQTPMGGNVVRLGALVAGPLVACALWGRRPALLAALAVPLLWWQWGAAADDWYRAERDPSVQQSYYAPLLRELQRRGAGAGTAPGRVEIPFTDNHWESRWVAPHVPLARGWERQLDVRRNAIFYDGRTLTPAAYRRWLDANAVRWVALSDAPLDYSAAAEAALVRRGLPYLREVWRDRHWRLLAVRDPAPLATGPAVVTRAGPQAVELDARAAGTVRLSIFFTPYWRLAKGDGCVERTADGRVRLRLRRPGRVRLDIAFDPTRMGARSPRCTPLGGAGAASRTR